MRDAMESLLRGRRPLWILLAYLVLPIDVLPDVLAPFGFIDDAVLAAAVAGLMLRRRMRAPGTAAGPQAAPRPRVIDGDAVEVERGGRLPR